MAYSDEKLLILKMLQEGKITSEEAAKLLEACEAGQKQSAGDFGGKNPKQSAFNDEMSKMKDRINSWKNDFKSNYNQKDFDRMIDDFSSKAEKLGKNVATTTFGIVDKMIDFVGSFVDTNSFHVFGSYNAVEKSYEAHVNEGMDLLVEGINGNILVKKHTGDQVIIKTKVRSPQNNVDSILAFEKGDTFISLKLNNPGNVSVSHEVFLPAVKLRNVKFETSNGKIYVEDTAAESFETATRNNNIDLVGVNSDHIKVSTKNAKIQISYVIGQDIEINTNNSVIDIKNIKAGNLKALTVNGRILVENVQTITDSQEINMTLKTTNGGIKVNMNDMDNKGYKVKAQTTNGDINLLIPELTYHSASRQKAGVSFVEAESNEYSKYPEKVSINAETINGYIEIVK